LSYRGLEEHGDHAPLLLRGELRIHREREHLGGDPLGDREVTAAEAERLVGLLEMERDGVVDARAETDGSEVLLQPLSIRDPHDVEVIDWSRPDGDVWADDRPFGIGEELVVVTCALSTLVGPLRQMTKFQP